MNETNSDIELFYQMVLSSIRERQVEYLRKKKAEPFPQALPKVDELSAGEYAKLKFWQKLVYKRMLKKQIKARNKALRKQKRPVDDDLTRGHNGGIELALLELECTYKAFTRRYKNVND